ncbi:MAG: VIT domain-containing protein [Myxococcota bacterium]|nr:VIT domain-containing protein [Myxococcota bacterium]
MTLSPTLPSASPSPLGLGALLALLDEGPTSLPLQSVKVRARVSGPIARAVVEMAYENDHAEILEVLHLFPVPPQGAVHGFVLRADDLEVQGVCREKEQARAEYHDAREQGHRAALLESHRPDVHQLKVANIPPKATITVRLELSWVLPWEGGRQRFAFPTTIAPRYLPGKVIGADGEGILPDTDRVPDASSLQPPVLLGEPAPLDLELEIDGAVKLLEVAQHSARTELGERVRITPRGGKLDRDFVVAFSLAQATPSLQAWTDGERTLVQVLPPTDLSAEPLPRDATFIVDISGSMSGTKMEAAKLALRTALRGLDAQDRFRLLAFDNVVEAYRDAAFLPLTEAELSAAEVWVDRLHPRGGTEMLAPLKLGLEPKAEPGRLHTLLFITDGQAWNRQELIAAVYHRRNAARLHTLGIDTAVNEDLLGQLARVGGGTATFCTPQDDIEERVAALESRFGAPLVQVTELGGLPRNGEVFSDQPALLWLESAPEAITLKARGPAGDFELETKAQRTDSLGAAFAKERIQALEDRLVVHPHEEEALKPAILKLSLAHQVLSSQTAFVAVDKSAKVLGPKVQVSQPSAVPDQWEGGGGAPMMAAAAPPPPSPMGARRPPGASAPPRGVKKSAKRPTPKRPASKRERGVVELFQRVFSGAPDMEEVEESMVLADEAPTIMAPSPAPPVFEPEPAVEDRVTSPAVGLVQSQRVDGSWGGVPETVAALLALVLLGNTRLTGARRRAVAKAARWLGKRSEPLAAEALEILAAAEAGQAPEPSELAGFVVPGPEGEVLAGLT